MQETATARRFRTCPLCGYLWRERDRFLADPGVHLLGYQVYFNALKAGVFLFNHTCGTTLAVEVAHFLDLYDGPIFKQRLRGTDACPGHCLRVDSLEPCPAQCECAFVREVLQQIQHWPKAS